MKILFKINLLVFFMLLTILTGSVNAQNRPQTDLRPFHYDVVVFPGPESQKARVDIYLWVKNTHLQFLRKDTLYHAQYQINLEIYKNENVALLTKDTTATVTETTYAATIDPQIQRVHLFRYKLSPNKYLFKARLLDLNSRSSRVEEIKETLASASSRKLDMSDILLLDKNDLNAITTDNILPRLSVPLQEKIYIYAEVITPAGVTELGINADISQKGEAKRFTSSNTLRATPPITIVLLELNKENMIRGQSQLRLVITAGRQSIEKLKSIRFIQSMSTEEVVGAGSLDDMIDQLGFVARGEEWKNLRNAVGEERENLFKEFWAKRDPTPGTEENELFDEYYKRIRIADQQFRTSKLDGWRSDRGRVYLIYGPPDNLERYNPTGSGFATYEVWYYDTIREKFVFFDEYGFGDYRLVSGNLMGY